MDWMWSIEEAQWTLEQFYAMANLYTDNWQQTAAYFAMNCDQLFQMIDARHPTGYIEYDEILVFQQANETLLAYNPMAYCIGIMLRPILAELAQIATMTPIDITQFRMVLEQVLMQYSGEWGIIIPETGVWYIEDY